LPAVGQIETETGCKERGGEELARQASEKRKNNLGKVAVTLGRTRSLYTTWRIVSLPMLRSYEGRIKLVGNLHQLQE
jgi:hypothetical protein